MFKRTAYDALLEWKRQEGKTSLLIEGARRVGKTTLATEFAKREYARHLIIDFSDIPDEVRNLFLNMRDNIDTFFSHLFLYYGISPIERDTLLVFDEVQFLPEARAFTKQLVADGRYDYITTGSLISIHENVKDILIPSEESHLRLNPLNFEEWLWACGEDVLASHLREAFDGKGDAENLAHQKASRLFREYLLVGGMPQAVQEYLDTRDFGKVDTVKRRIIDLYRQDMARYARGEATRVRAIFDAIPGQLAKHEKKFTLASLGSQARMREYHDAFFWLSEAHLVNMCHAASDPGVGLTLSLEQSAFKCYMADTGLLVSHAFADNAETTHEAYKALLFGKLRVNEGMIVENYVAQQLRASSRNLFFYSRRGESARDTMEIDFLIVRAYDDAAMKPRVSPVEVKSSNRYSTASLDKFCAKFRERIGTEFVLHPGAARVEGRRRFVPLYQAHLL